MNYICVDFHSFIRVPNSRFQRLYRRLISVLYYLSMPMGRRRTWVDVGVKSLLRKNPKSGEGRRGARERRAAIGASVEDHAESAWLQEVLRASARVSVGELAIPLGPEIRRTGRSRHWRSFRSAERKQIRVQKQGYRRSSS